MYFKKHFKKQSVNKCNKKYTKSKVQKKCADISYIRTMEKTMSINGLTINRYNGIDVNNVQKVTSDILSSLENKTVDVSKVDLTRFTRAKQGTDLYSNKVSLDVQRQIAMTNAGLLDTTPALQSVQMLNAQAAAAIYNPKTVEKNVEGKMHVNANAEMETFAEAGNLQASMNVFETNKDKKGSNPFSFGKSQENEKEEKKQPLNLLA